DRRPAGGKWSAGRRRQAGCSRSGRAVATCAARVRQRRTMEANMTTLDKLAALGLEFADGQTEPTTTTVEVPDIAALRSLLDLGLDADGRRAHFDAMFEADGAEEDV